MKKRNALHFELMRSKYLDLAERGVLLYINTYSDVCCPGLMSNMSSNLGMTDRNLRRILKRLELKGLIIRRYTFYKKLRIFLVNLETQIQIWKNILANRVTVFDQRKNIVKKTIGAATTACLTQLSNSFRKKSYRTLRSEPILEENISIINTETRFEFLGIKAVEVKKPLTDVQLHKRKDEALLNFKAHLMQQLAN